MLGSLLAHARFYSLFENLIGAARARRLFLERHVRPRPGDRVLDIGCGPADILEELADVDYHGFDLSPEYIDAARARFGHRGHFHVQAVTMDVVKDYEGFDLVLAVGVLHHLEDAVAVDLFRVALAALKPGGRLVTLDGCFADGQSPVASRLLRNDRGQFVRREDGYAALARQVFPEVHTRVSNDLLRIPYTHLAMECTKPRENGGRDAHGDR